MKKILATEERCSADVWEDLACRFFQCSRRGTVERQGKRFCKQHDPDAIKAKREAERVRFASQNKASAAERRVAAWEADVVKAVLAAKASSLPADVADARRTLLDAMDVAKHARAALGVKP